jgi:outer membrane receptor protein involved in Fe transport
VRRILLAGAASVLTFGPAHALAADAARAKPASAASNNTVQQVVITASRTSLLGVATTSSQGQVTKQELALRPVYRVGQLLETIPGLTVTAHSGEGKANQYLLRGFNLDHGTDLATTIDGMPVNMRTHAHGQGYTDLNFFIPELSSGVSFTKGPYFAAEGDFASVGADHIRFVDQMRPQISASAGTVGDQRVFAGGSADLGDNHLLAAGEFVHLDGPWVHPDNFRKLNLALRYSGGDNENGFSVTGLYYRGLWNATTDQPLRAITSGLISRYGTLDPSDGGQARRYSLSGSFVRGTQDWRVNANAYVVRNELTLWNDFTHFLDDPVNGDQEAQDDRRTIIGGSAAYTLFKGLKSRESDTTAGVQVRYDDIYVDQQHTRDRIELARPRADKVKEVSVGLYAQNTTFWANWLRTIVGVREDVFHASDHNIAGGVSGSQTAGLFQPKGSIVFGPWAQTELYLSGGEGFHSNDVRAGLDPAGQYVRPPFLVKSKGYELGVRTRIIPKVQAEATLFQMDFDSEITYNADVGQDEAGPPSRRRGVEFSAQYRPFRWIELSADVAATHSRYRGVAPGEAYIPDAPSVIITAGALVDNLGPWFGGLEFRDLGSHPLIQDNSYRSSGYREVNFNVGYKLTAHVKVRMDVYNLTDSKDDAADYLYIDRLQGEPAAGVQDLHIHPLEPRSARFTVTATF